MKEVEIQAYALQQQMVDKPSHNCRANTGWQMSLVYRHEDGHGDRKDARSLKEIDNTRCQCEMFSIATHST